MAMVNNEEHPMLRIFLKDHACDEVMGNLAFLVYKDLCEVRAWRNVELHFSPSLGRPYVSGRSCLSSPLEVVLPLSVDSSVSHAYIQSLFEHLQIGGQNFNRIILGVCASDSSIVYYKVSRDIIRPETPEITEAKRQQWAQKAAKRKRQLTEYVEVFSQLEKSD
ncbi:probable tRNA-splicing endonuclease subunit sen15 [Pomacea canaliculata]|uniref:probable tRNA-splicing endonuclease subunit sen15 n=1 Tax=Pomacea canaliculata TaxID=400727 RepID=UPI000D738FD5|nr:probable tRNA-splicing endonuclease subunit sen15 [Pomacea canaliculata]